MKKIILFLMFSLINTTAYAAPNLTTWEKSPALEQLIVELKQHYASLNLFKIDKIHLKQVDRLPYFILHIDEEGTPEKAQLEAYLWGTQRAHTSSNYQQIITNITPWFCPKESLAVSYLNPNKTRFIENIIYEALERILKRETDAFKNGRSAFLSLSGLVMYGLQTKYPCYESIPEAHRLAGYVY